MYFDNLSLAGIAVVALYGLLPLLFGRETLRVEEDDAETPSRPVTQTDRHDPRGPGCPADPCPEA